MIKATDDVANSSAGQLTTSAGNPIADNQNALSVCPDFIHTQKRHPKTNLRSPTAMWDFWSLSPESLHQVTILMSDRGLPTSVRHVNGYGSHTYSLISTAGERVWVKFHFKTRQGHQHWTNAQPPLHRSDR